MARQDLAGLARRWQGLIPPSGEAQKYLELNLANANGRRIIPAAFAFEFPKNPYVCTVSANRLPR
jgi:hypothetical protein